METPDENITEIRVESNPVRLPFAPAGPDAPVVRVGVMVYDNLFIGPHAPNTDLVIKAFWPNPVFSAPRPRIVHLQPRQSDNLNFGFPDQFALMVIETDVDYIMFRIRRLDNGAQPTGWGQNLMLDMLVIDDGSEPPFGGG